MSLQERLGLTGAPEGPSVSPLPMPISSVPINGLGVGRRNSRRAYDPLAAVRKRAHQALLELLGPQLYETVDSDTELDKRVREALPGVLNAEETPLTATDRALAYRQILDEVLGHGPIEPLLRDPEVTEIMVNAWDRIYVERYGHIHPVDAAFMDEAHLRRVIDKIVSRVGRRVDEASPMVDARMPDGSRVNAVVPPIALDGAALTVRKFAAEPFTVADLIKLGTFPPQVAQLLEACVQGRLDIVVSGGTGTGKTTLLNVISSFLPADDRIITIEDSAELRLAQEHVLRMEYRPPNIEGKGEITIRDLVRNALRMRPDRIVVGEVRDGAALDMLQAMNTGHDGSLTTVHANTPRDSLARLETMVLMAGMDLPVRAIREQVASAVDLIIQLARLRDGSRRITHITEVTGMEGDVITMQDLFTFDLRAGHDQMGRHQGMLRSTGLRPRFMETFADHGITLPVELFGRGR
ncbi:type II secretion system protein E [Rhizocola hellebori]|uniref:Type II secretion system protein E n=1 Tax=Rhizocola hellebori TaxID=1392758 RepID=A0A8J3VJW8_9ACTN|nr:CpaF family protein [Rhizocola hellebori]GIH08922.1 type II secretion system protein E [Rhizocola hellebori]